MKARRERAGNLYWPVRECEEDICSLEYVGPLYPRSKYKCRGDRAFSVVAPRLWNELPITIRLAPSVSAFKSSLKTYV